MSLSQFLFDIAAYARVHPLEKSSVVELQALVQTRADAFLRTSFLAGVSSDGVPFRGGHVTASMLVMSSDREKVLLMKHATLGKLLQFGGHSDGEVDSRSVALRECMEESWLTKRPVIFSEIFDIDIHTIPENLKKGEPEHVHYDVLYLATIDPSIPFSWDTIETNGVDWYTIQMAHSHAGATERLQKLLKRATEVGA